MFRDAEWKAYCVSQPVSKFLNVSLEAFGILVYCNSYDLWCSRFKAKGTAEEEASEENDKEETKFPKFTTSVQAQRGHVQLGWSAEGIQLYNTITRILKVQQAAVYSKEFERKLMRACAKKRGGGRKKKQSIIIAENSLDELIAEAQIN